MRSSNCFMSSAEPCGDAIMRSNSPRSDTSISETIVQYCSAQKSVITRIRGMPTFSLSFDILTNFSTIGRTLPGLQYMISRMRYMDSSREIVPGQLSRVLRAALFGGVLVSGCHHRPHVEPLLLEQTYCWWSSQYLSVVPVWVASRFQESLTAAGFPGGAPRTVPRARWRPRISRAS